MFSPKFKNFILFAEDKENSTALASNVNEKYRVRCLSEVDKTVQ